MKPRKHAELIKAWADGAEIQFMDSRNNWHDCANVPPSFNDVVIYRVKPTKPAETKKVSVGGRMVNLPVTELPEIGVAYWVVSNSTSMFRFCRNESDKKQFENLGVFESEQDAIEWRDAWSELKKQAIAGKAIGVIERKADGGWVDWHGGECPVAKNANVAVMYRSGLCVSRTADEFSWSIYRDNYDIIKYKVLREN